MSYQHKPVRIAIIEKIRNSKCCDGCGEKETLGKYKLVQPLWKTIWWFFQQLKIELSYDTAIPLPGIYLKKTKTQS